MFTGIIECLGIIEEIVIDGSNKHIKVKSELSNQLKVDQSVAHDGVCLTVTKIENDCYWVTAINETLIKTNLNSWVSGTEVNIERCLKLGDRLDGHWVQGHVDTTGICQNIFKENGSWILEIVFSNSNQYRTIQKGSITLNGISLTVIDSKPGMFTVAIIPYTYEHTNIKNLITGNHLNLEFDIMGKWVKEWMK